METSNIAGYLYEQDARRLVESIFIHSGFDGESAHVLADNLIFADLRGVSTHGISRVQSYCERARKGFCNVRPEIQILHETAATLLVDGDNGYGAVVGKRAMEWTIEKARVSGAAFCSVRNSSHFGAAANFTLMAARAGMIGFACTNGPANMAHFGSSQPMLGTNPFSIAAPAGQRPALLLDIATSVAARGNILNAAREGQSIPSGWALDGQGHPTTDPQEALKGCVLPFGGHKGSGIAILIDTLCGVLSGAEFGVHVRQQTSEGMQRHKGPGIGHLFVVIDPTCFCTREEFEQRIDQQISDLKSAKPLPGFHEILMPGELEERYMQENSRRGIPIAKGTFKNLCELCAELKTGFDPQQYLHEVEPKKM